MTAVCDKYQCCTREFIPLKIAFGKTVHTFQGASAGPVREGQPPNPIMRLVCDPGARRFEGVCIGLFYTILSRITSLGTDKMSSAVYFIGKNMNPQRIRNLTLSADGRTPYKNVEKRTAWVEYLQRNAHGSNFSNNYILELFKWIETTRVTDAQLQSIIKFHQSKKYIRFKFITLLNL